jgi:hypothetical protein
MSGLKTVINLLLVSFSYFDKMILEVLVQGHLALLVWACGSTVYHGGGQEAKRKR